MKPHMRAITGFLDDLGATDIVIVNGGKHPRVVFWYGGQEYQRVISGTPTNPDECARRAVEDIRRQLGLIDHEKRVGERRWRSRRRGPAPAVSARAALAAPPLPDWRDDLWGHPAGAALLRGRLDAAWNAWWRQIMARVDTQMAANQNDKPVAGLDAPAAAA
jgi:hypothetical protein